MSIPCGIMLPVGCDARRIIELAVLAEDAGADELWVPEDLGLHGGVALATAVLSATQRVPVGLGIAPAAARHPAFLAMQAATLGQLFPARFLLGIGHGMPDWMRDLGIWPSSPLARLEETLDTVRRLLAGEQVTFVGKEVQLHGVRLAGTPVDVPLYAGVRGPRSLEVAGRFADGVILAGWAGPAYIREAVTVVREAANGPRRTVASARFALGSGERTAAERLGEDLAQAGTSLATMLPGVLASRVTSGEISLSHLLPEVAIAGQVSDLLRGIRRWHDAGADLVLLDPLTVPDLEALIDSRVLV